MTPDWLLSLREQWRLAEEKRRLKAAFRRKPRPAKPKQGEEE